MPEKTKADPYANMLHLSASAIIELLVERHLAQMGWNPETKKCDLKPVVCRPVVLVGPAGIGKSELPAQAAERVSQIIGEPVDTRSCNLQFLEAPDLAGLAMNVERDGELVTVHGRPGLLPKAGKGIWFLDEPNRVNRDIRSAMLTLVQARMVNDYKIGSDWMMVMAMNPAEFAGVSYEVAEWDRALKDRVTFVWFEPSIQELLTYLRGKYRNHVVIRWIESAGLSPATNHLLALKGEESRITPRGVEFLIRAINAAGGVRSANWFRAATAEIGRQLATVLSTFVQSVNSVKPEDVLDNLSDEVIEKLKCLEEDGRMDVLSVLNDSVTSLMNERYIEMFKTFQPPEGKDALASANLFLDSPESEKMIQNITRYLEIAPADLKSGFFYVGGEKMLKFPNRSVFFVLCQRVMLKSPILKTYFQRLKEVQRSAEKVAVAAKAK